MSQVDVLLLILFVLFIGMDVRKKNINTETRGLSYEQSCFLKGLGSIMIFFHHITQRTEGIVFLYVGYLGVSIFFFLSGYGLSTCWIKDENYAKKILKQKIPNIILMSIFTVILMTAFYWIIDEPVLWTELVFTIKGNRLLNWFFPATIIIYVIFSICALLSKKNKQRMLIYNAIAIGVLIIILSLLFLKNIIGRHWFISLLAFILGEVFALYPEITNCINRRITLFCSKRSIVRTFL